MRAYHVFLTPRGTGSVSCVFADQAAEMSCLTRLSPWGSLSVDLWPGPSLWAPMPCSVLRALYRELCVAGSSCSWAWFPWGLLTGRSYLEYLWLSPEDTLCTHLDTVSNTPVS